MINPTRYLSILQTGSELLLGRLVVAVVVTTFLFLAGVSSSSFAQGGGGGGGVAPDLGDLIILYRDDNGVPYPSPEVQVEDPESGLLVNGGLCWQPIAFNVSDEPDTLCPTSCVVDSVPAGAAVVSVDQYSCAVAVDCSGCTQEVDFGRINAARSPDEVFDRQMEDVVLSLTTADCITLDPAGRLVANDVALDDNLIKTIDSPLQNLAIYRELILKGFIGDAPGIDLPDDNFYNTAARGLGAASDKSGGVNVDLVSYINQIMGLSDPATTTMLGKLCETYREEVQGVIQEVEKCYLNYGTDQSDVLPAGANYVYNRATNFGGDGGDNVGLPNPAYIPQGEAINGWFEWLAVVAASDPPSFQIDQGPIQDAVFCLDGDGNPLAPIFGTDCTELVPVAGIVADYDGENVGAFAQASDDARAVISFMHTNQVPVDYETPLRCGGVIYDLSISLSAPATARVGVPGIITATTANLGPDHLAEDAVVTVTGVTNRGTQIGPFEDTVGALANGASVDSAFNFVPPNDRSSVINWSSTVSAPGDIDPSNNSAVAVTRVRR